VCQSARSNNGIQCSTLDQYRYNLTSTRLIYTRRGPDVLKSLPIRIWPLPSSCLQSVYHTVQTLKPQKAVQIYMGFNLLVVNKQEEIVASGFDDQVTCTVSGIVPNLMRHQTATRGNCRRLIVIAVAHIMSVALILVSPVSVALRMFSSARLVTRTIDGRHGRDRHRRRFFHGTRQTGFRSRAVRFLLIIRFDFTLFPPFALILAQIETDTIKRYMLCQVSRGT